LILVYFSFFADLKENLCDEKENTISNHKINKLTENKEMADSDTKEYPEENEDVNSNHKNEIDDKKSTKEDVDEEQNGDDNDNEDTSEINYNVMQAGLEASASAAASASAVLNEANALFNTAMFQPGQMSMQTFQNAIAQFTANAIANNMDNETVMKNLAILQSALFTLQQQQFLQFQLIQHLQSQLATNKKGSDGGSVSDKMNNKSESDDEDQDKIKESMELDENELEEDEIIESNEIHKRLLESKHNFSKMDAIVKESENR
jgi:hypothetical protein